MAAAQISAPTLMTDDEWMDPVKFPSELSVDPSKIVKVVDWGDVILNAFGVGLGHDETRSAENIKDMLYAIQSWTEKSKWDNGNRGNLEDIKMTRVALSPNYAYYEGVWGDGVDIYRTSDGGDTFELWMHEYEQYPSCYPQVIMGKLTEGPKRGKKFVYLAGEGTMCKRLTLSNGTNCWIADKSKKIPEEVTAMEQECD